ncbi:putative pumilio homolog 19 [Pistacia vera]|uniref:putative pumilio homolog 19 n=2 Tax=Pistacia vera TaxID=55513 RepID=UPI001262C36A|nr:putative pumilio homolog 19 [Pistacia vera]
MASGNYPEESLLLSLINLSLSGHGSSTSRTHQPSPMPPIMTPPFSQSIWADHCPSNTGGANLQYMPWNLQDDTMRVNLNSGFGVGSMSFWGNQENPFGQNLGSASLGGRGYMSNDYNSLNLYNNGMASQDYVASHQESLSSNEVRGINAVLGLEDSDIILLSNDQWSSEYLQKLLCLKDSRIVNKMMGVVYSFPIYLMTHQYGHHLFVKLIESCDEEQRGLITTTITSDDELFLTASVSKFGSLCIKRLIKKLVGSPLISLVISALHRIFKDTMLNGKGSSVIIYCLETLSDQQNELLYVAAINHFRDLATHVVGCISFNNFINDMRGPHRAQLLDLISCHAAFLSKDPSGNFVVQHVLELRDPILTQKICFILRGKYVELSLLKYGSHVVEKCLKSPGMAHYAVEDFLKSRSQLFHLARHKYGNYVIQTALKVTKSENISLHRRLLHELRDYHDLQFGYGRKLYNLIAAGVPVGGSV